MGTGGCEQKSIRKVTGVFGRAQDTEHKEPYILRISEAKGPQRPHTKDLVNDIS